MSADTETIDRFVAQEYKWGFVTDIEADTLPPGLDEDVVRHISAKKNEPEWLLEFAPHYVRRHRNAGMAERERDSGFRVLAESTAAVDRRKW